MKHQQINIRSCEPEDYLALQDIHAQPKAIWGTLQLPFPSAERWLNLSRLELIVFTDNTPAIKLYKRAGFRVEGTLRKFAFRDGEYVDAHTMARLGEGR